MFQLLNTRLVMTLGIAIFTQIQAHSWENTLGMDRSKGLRELPALSIHVGEQRYLKIPGLKRFTLGSEQVRALPPRRELQKLYQDAILLRAVRPGHSDLWAWKQDGTIEHRPITVLEAQTGQGEGASTLPAELAAGISLLQEAEVQLLSGSKVLLTGPLLSIHEARLVYRLSRGFETLIKNETTLSPSLLNQVKNATAQLLQKFSNEASQKLKIEQLGDSIWVRGHLSNAKTSAEIFRQLRSSLPMVQWDVESLPDNAPVTSFKVFLLEMKRTMAQGMGLQWPGTNGFGAFHVSPAHWSGRDILQFDLQIQAWESEGKIKVLSAPELVVRTPGEAELFAGGEIPIRSQNKFRSQVEWKSFGLLLKLKTTHSTSDQVRLEIHSEVSSLTPGIIDDPIPGLSTNRMKTQVDAQYGTPLFLSGLLQEKISETSSGLPFLRRLPILGKLFSSEDYQHERSELIAILFPSQTLPNIRKSALAREVTAQERLFLQNPGEGWLFEATPQSSPQTPLPKAEEVRTQNQLENSKKRKLNRLEKSLLLTEVAHASPLA